MKKFRSPAVIALPPKNRISAHRWVVYSLSDDLYLPPTRQTQRHNQWPPNIDQFGAAILGHAEISGGRTQRCRQRVGRADRRRTDQEPHPAGFGECNQGVVGGAERS